MNEFHYVWLGFGNLIALSFACLCYSLGGRAGGPGKWMRRFIASLIIAASINVTALFLQKWVFWLLISYPLLIAQYSLGYGSENVGIRVLKRFLIALLNIACGVGLIFVFAASWWILLIHAIVCLVTVVFAFKNPLPAAVEELFVCILSSGVLLLYPLSF